MIILNLNKKKKKTSVKTLNFIKKQPTNCSNLTTKTKKSTVNNLNFVKKEPANCSNLTTKNSGI